MYILSSSLYIDLYIFGILVGSRLCVPEHEDAARLLNRKSLKEHPVQPVLKYLPTQIPTKQSSCKQGAAFQMSKLGETSDGLFLPTMYEISLTFICNLFEILLYSAIQWQYCILYVHYVQR